MLFTQFNMEDALEVRYEEGFEDGEISKLIQLVCRKLQKNKEPSAIAEELEEDLALIEKICEAIKIVGADMDLDRIYEELKRLS